MVAEMEKNEHAFDVDGPGEKPQHLILEILATVSNCCPVL